LTTSEYSEVTYLYRDAGNYKFWGSFKICGRLDVAALRDHMFQGNYFIPARVGIPALTPDARNDDDHDLHEIEDIRLSEPGAFLCSADELVLAFRKENTAGWFR